MKKEKTLSSKWFKVYKFILLGFMSVFIAFYVVSAVQSMTSWIMIPVVCAYIILIVTSWLPAFRKMMRGFKRISYDDTCLYVAEANYDIEVPLEKVKDVELISLDGIYKFTLYEEDQFGDAIYCKPSMWYPFNFSRVDKELDWIRYLIKKRKEKVWAAEEGPAFLSSQNQ